MFALKFSEILKSDRLHERSKIEGSKKDTVTAVRHTHIQRPTPLSPLISKMTVTNPPMRNLT